MQLPLQQRRQKPVKATGSEENVRHALHKYMSDCLMSGNGKRHLRVAAVSVCLQWLSYDGFHIIAVLNLYMWLSLLELLLRVLGCCLNMFVYKVFALL